MMYHGWLDIGVPSIDSLHPNNHAKKS
jgi:hypothetical protein